MDTQQYILVTGGLGFIGSHYIRKLLNETSSQVINLDKFTYAANQHCCDEFQSYENYTWIKADICDSVLVQELFDTYKFKIVVHFAAESHVDNSIETAQDFIQTNIVGTHALLQTAYQYWMNSPNVFKEGFQDSRFIQISTDEVFGSLKKNDKPFSEKSPFAPNSPYSASKASADLLARSYFHTYGFPVIKTHCSNNYGAFQHQEKLIPKLILNALQEKPLPLYGDGKQSRDWIHVSDHCDAIQQILEKGNIGESYLIGACQEYQNIEIAHHICDLLDNFSPRKNKLSYRDLISFVEDRPGHDLRYAIDASKLNNELGWEPKLGFEKGIEAIVRWYIDNKNFNS